MREEKRTSLEDIVWLAIVIAFCWFIVTLISGCAEPRSLGDPPASEWTGEDDKRCYRQGGLPTYNHNSERTMCSTDIIW